MRGKGLQGFSFILPVGITPAYAGKRASPRCRFCFLGDHPRLCGEKSLSGFALGL